MIIEVKDLSFAYQSDHQILDNVSFEIRKGEKSPLLEKMVLVKVQSLHYYVVF